MPTNISTNSEPEIEKNGTLASPATALASSVVPVPGGPTSSAPLGIFAPICLYLSGLCRKSTISCSASLASSSPATSLNLMPVSEATYILALLLPKDMAFAPTPPIFLISARETSWPTTAKITMGSTHVMRKLMMGDISFALTSPNLQPESFRRFTSSGSLNVAV